MPLMKLLQNIDSDDKTTTKHKKLPQSDNESDEDIVSFPINNFHMILVLVYYHPRLSKLSPDRLYNKLKCKIDVDLPRQWIDDARHASRVIRLM